MFHNHVGTYVETPAETARLLDETDPAKVGWCLDIGHLAYGGGNSLAMLGAYGDRVAHIHLKDVDGDILAGARAEVLELRPGPEGVHLPAPGRGDRPGPGGGAQLLARGYDGWFVLEQDTYRGTRWMPPGTIASTSSRSWPEPGAADGAWLPEPRACPRRGGSWSACGRR